MSRIVFGTTSLGLPYGLPDASGASPVLLDDSAVERLVARALEAGVTTFDTAPGYGVAEERLGRFLPPKARVWTKIDRRGVEAAALPDFAARSVASSRQRLRRQSLASVQWHNFEASWLGEPGFIEAVARLHDDTEIASIGATTYGLANALAAVECGLFTRVQVEWNLLNQGVVRGIEAIASKRGVAIAVRSVLLQGALTSEGRTLPDRPRLHRGLERAREVAGSFSNGLTELAYRAAFSTRSVDHVLIGFRSATELDQALCFEGQPLLDLERIEQLERLDLEGDESTDPRAW